MEWQYLEAEREANALSLAGVPQPQEALRDLAKLGPAHFEANPVDEAKLGWLKSLRTVGMLDASNTTYGAGARPTARERLETLTQKWNTSTAPKALAEYDVPLQWAICVGGFALGAWLTLLFVRVASKSYRWNPPARTLTLPSGATLAPQDLADVDKRKWHKFLVTLKIADAHPQLGGQDVRLDLYRYTPLEEWVLEMERTQFPDRQEPPAASAAGGPDGSGEPGGSENEEVDGSAAARLGTGA
jgi:hypothetical protein